MTTLGMRLTDATLRQYALGTIFVRSAPGVEYQVWEGPAGLAVWVRRGPNDRESTMHTGHSLAELADVEPDIGFNLPAWTVDEDLPL